MFWPMWDKDGLDEQLDDLPVATVSLFVDMIAGTLEKMSLNQRDKGNGRVKGLAARSKSFAESTLPASILAPNETAFPGLDV